MVVRSLIIEGEGFLNPVNSSSVVEGGRGFCNGLSTGDGAAPKAVRACQPVRSPFPRWDVCTTRQIVGNEVEDPPLPSRISFVSFCERGRGSISTLPMGWVDVPSRKRPAFAGMTVLPFWMDVLPGVVLDSGFRRNDGWRAGCLARCLSAPGIPLRSLRSRVPLRVETPAKPSPLMSKGELKGV